MTSIKQNPRSPSALPNFCNLGVMLRVLMIVNALAFGVSASRATRLAEVGNLFADLAGFVEPALLASLVLGCALRRWLSRLSYAASVTLFIALELTLVTLWQRVALQLEGSSADRIVQSWLFTLTAAAIVLWYFHMREKALSPAIDEARLQALQARIRPHFLFNSINAVLSLIRAEPKRAEKALEDMADLFRVLMADNRALVKLEDEVTLSWQYLNLEQLRLGARLNILWHDEKMPREALIPPLVLQPLLENAVYHGIEPAASAGEIDINIYRRSDRVHIVIRNTYEQDGAHHQGNKMALGNIRERLALHYDAEASLDAKIVGAMYQVHIVIPYITERYSAA